MDHFFDIMIKAILTDSKHISSIEWNGSKLIFTVNSKEHFQYDVDDSGYIDEKASIEILATNYFFTRFKPTPKTWHNR